MELSCGHIRPGRVLEVIDNKGTIKGCCCGLFSDQDDPKKLPPIYPFPLGGANTFSSPRLDDDIWVVFFDDNPMELFYLRKDNFPTHLNTLLSTEYEHVDVLASRELSTGMVQLYFADGEGWVIRNLDSVIRMRPDGSILLDSGSAHRKIDLCDDSISLGSEGGSAHPAAYGDKVVTSLKKLDTLLSAIASAAGSNPYTLSIKLAIETFQQAFEDSLDDIESMHVTLD